MLQIHDTMAGALVEFVPREPGLVSMYVCGPTVYDVPHIGHGRTALVFDMMRRYLEWSGFEVTYVSNVTDIEDKIIARAAEIGSSETELSERYTAAYWTEMDRLGVIRPDEAPHATQFVGGMQALIAELIEQGSAYVIEGEGVYFEVARYGAYGELAHRERDDLLESAGARVEVDERKRSPLDFALWKAAKPGEPTWESPWGPGRPGWHIECAAMSLRILGDGFDVHGGGDDLVFPHHENERAEAEGAGHVFARYWLHSAMVNVDGEKMSKSLGNFVNLADAVDAVGPRAFRLAALRPHYRSQIELGRAVLDDAKRAVARLDALARRARTAGVEASDERDPQVMERFRGAMDDDFSTPAAFAVVFEAVSAANQAIDDARSDATCLLGTAGELLDVLGVGLGEPTTGDEEIDSLVAAREDARAARDFDEADRIRAELAGRGVVVEDTSSGPVWHR
jgi:cysteinyl-tRNA synthetase